jgi:hypothetical protein
MKSLALSRVLLARRGDGLDFIVSGRSLYQELHRRGYDLVPRLGSSLVPVDVAMRDLLTLERVGDTASGRVALYVCPLCAHLGCGVVSARITRDGADILWSDFAYETDRPEDLHAIERLGPYRFRETEYRQALSAQGGTT